MFFMFTITVVHYFSLTLLVFLFQYSSAILAQNTNSNYQATYVKLAFAFQ